MNTIELWKLVDIIGEEMTEISEINAHLDTLKERLLKDQNIPVGKVKIISGPQFVLTVSVNNNGYTKITCRKKKPGEH
jgi:hypothetical protein